ncbi:MAG: zinc ribbon domain-containing protein [Actinomycetota bacterium]
MSACGSCGHPLRDDDAFCSSCGARREPAVVSLTGGGETAVEQRTVVGARRRNLVPLVAVVALLAVAGLVALSRSTDEPEAEASPTTTIASPPTEPPTTEPAPPPPDPVGDDEDLVLDGLDQLGLGPNRLAVRSGEVVFTYDPDAGSLLARHDLTRSSGGDIWFGDDELIMRSQGQTGPGMSVLELDTGRFRNYVGINFIVSDASADLVVGQEFGRFFGGGRWAVVDVDGFSIDRVEIAGTPAFTFLAAAGDGVLLDEGGQIVHLRDGERTALGSGTLISWSEEAALIGTCDAELDCRTRSVAFDGSDIVEGPGLTLPPLSLGGEVRWLSPDGRILAAVDPAARLLDLIDVETGESLPHELGRTGTHSLLWTPDSTRVIVADDDAVAVVDVASGAVVSAPASARVDQVGFVDPT